MKFYSINRIDSLCEFSDDPTMNMSQATWIILAHQKDNMWRETNEHSIANYKVWRRINISPTEKFWFFKLSTTLVEVEKSTFECFIDVYPIMASIYANQKVQSLICGNPCITILSSINLHDYSVGYRLIFGSPYAYLGA